MSMTQMETSTVVLQDTAGHSFLISPQTLEQGRVPAEQRPDLERLIAAALPSEACSDDVHGHILPTLPIIFAGFVAYSVGVVGGFAVTNAVVSSTPEKPSGPSPWPWVGR